MDKPIEEFTIDELLRLYHSVSVHIDEYILAKCEPAADWYVLKNKIADMILYQKR
jgi:hypothetical protein